MIELNRVKSPGKIEESGSLGTGGLSWPGAKDVPAFAFFF